MNYENNQQTQKKLDFIFEPAKIKEKTEYKDIETARIEEYKLKLSSHFNLSIEHDEEKPNEELDKEPKNRLASVDKNLDHDKLHDHRFYHWKK